MFFIKSNQSDFEKWKPFILAAIAILVVLVVVFVLSRKPKLDKFTPDYDSFNDQLVPNGQEDNVSSKMYDKNSGLLMSNTVLDNNEQLGKFDAMYEEQLPLREVVPPNSYLLDDGDNGKKGFHTNMCSKLCCSAQYPLPFKIDLDKRLCGVKDLVPSNIMCNNAWQSSGCACVTKDQAEFMQNRGGNA